MVIMVNGVPLSEPVGSLAWLDRQHPQVVKLGSSQLTPEKTREISARGSLYVSVREFAVVRQQDSRVNIIGTDNLTNNVAIIMKNTETGSVLLGHMDRLSTVDLEQMLVKLGAPPNSQDPTPVIELHLAGGYSDNKRVSDSIITPILNILQSSPRALHLTSCTLGSAYTVYKEGGCPYPLAHGVGVHVPTASIFPVTFGPVDSGARGPDLDLRIARILTSACSGGGHHQGGSGAGGTGPGGDSEANLLLDIYCTEREELRLGPFSYSPMRSVDIWLEQTDDFILQSLSPCPDVVADRATFVSEVRAALRLVKCHPYPAVTLFLANTPRTYAKDLSSGQWLPASGVVPVVTSGGSPVPSSPPATATTTASNASPYHQDHHGLGPAGLLAHHHHHQHPHHHPHQPVIPNHYHAKPEPPTFYQDDLSGLAFKQEPYHSLPAWQEAQIYY